MSEELSVLDDVRVGMRVSGISGRNVGVGSTLAATDEALKRWRIRSKHEFRCAAGFKIRKSLHPTITTE